MSEAEIVYIAVIPLANPSVELVKAVVGIIGKDAYQTRLLLMGSMPRIVARCDGVKEAEAMGRKLRDIGLTTIVCPDAELRGPFQGLRARSLEFGGKWVTFKAEGGGVVTLEADSVFLIVKGTRQSATVLETARTILPQKPKRKMNVGATLMLGGAVPIYQDEKPKQGQAEDTQAEWFLRLYQRHSSDPSVEILQYSLDYSFLGAGAVASSVANFISVEKRLREIYSKAIYDERLMKAICTDIPMTTHDEDIDINCRLIYFQHRP